MLEVRGFILDGLGMLVGLPIALCVMIGSSVMAGYAVNDSATIWDNMGSADFSAQEKRRRERRSWWCKWGVILTFPLGFAANGLVLVSTMLFQTNPDTHIPHFWVVLVAEVLVCVAWISYLLRARRRWHDKEHLIMPFVWFKDGER